MRCFDFHFKSSATKGMNFFYFEIRSKYETAIIWCISMNGNFFSFLCSNIITTTMRNNYFQPVLLLVSLLVVSCSSDDKSNSNNQAASRPSVPVVASEVQIGTQTWMTKNLNVSHYRNGDVIPQVTDDAQWINLTTGAWCYYGNNAANGSIYGKLYNWYAVNDPRGLAPLGWHVASDAEWNTIGIFLGGDGAAGGKMKSVTGWNPPNAAATNSSGFTGIPSGIRSGTYVNMGNGVNFWSSSASSSSDAWFRTLSYSSSAMNRGNISKIWGESVRCIKN